MILCILYPYNHLPSPTNKSVLKRWLTALRLAQYPRRITPTCLFYHIFVQKINMFCEKTTSEPSHYHIKDILCKCNDYTAEKGQKSVSSL